MKATQIEKIFLTTDEINIINQFNILIGDINRIAESKDLREVCDDILIGAQKLVPYIFSKGTLYDYEEDM